MRKITYLQKTRSFVLSIPTLNATQTRRLVRKSASSRAIGSTERVSEGGQLTQLQHCPSPQRWCSRKSRRGRRDWREKKIERENVFSILHIAEIHTENITVGEGGGWGYLHTENDKQKVTTRCTEPRQMSRK